MFCNELILRLSMRATFDIAKQPHGWLLEAVFDEIYELMDNERGDKRSLWSDYTKSALRKLKDFISVNEPVEIYRLALCKQTQELSACVESNQEVVVKERIAVGQKYGDDDDDICRVLFGPNRLPSKMPAKK